MGGVAVLRPGPREQPPLPQAGVLQNEQVVARRHAGTAVAHDPRGVRDAHPGQPLPQAADGEEGAIGGEVLAAGQIAGAGNMPGARVDRLAVTAVARTVAGVEDDQARIGSVAETGEAVRGPGTRREPGGRLLRRCLFKRGLLQRALVGRPTAVQQCRLVAGHPEHPDQAGRDGSPGVVVGHDRAVVGDAKPGHTAGEHGRVGKRVPPRRRAGPGGEPPVEVHEYGAGQVAGAVGVASRAAVQVPADVGQDDLIAMLLPPADADHGPDHPVTLPGQMTPGGGPKPLPRLVPGKAH